MTNSNAIELVENKVRELIDSLSRNSRRKESSLSQYIGSIDSLNGNTLAGWVVNQQDKNESVDFNIYLGDEKIGVGSADIFRSDLEEAGYGNGVHGFQVEIADADYQHSSENISLVAVNTGEAIKTNGFSLGGRANLIAEISGISDRRLTAIITDASGSDMDYSVEVLVDGRERLPCSQEKKDIIRTRVDAVLPDCVFDGMPHTYEVVVNNARCLSSVHVDVLSSVTTPDDILTDSLGKDGYQFASKTALQRYQSLVRSVEQHVEQAESHQSLENILLAHRVLEAGPKKRRSYDTLSLPAISSPEVSIIVSARDHFHLTYHCLASLILARNRTTFEVLLVDDQSNDETVDADIYLRNLRVIKNKSNIGYLRSNNKAVSEAKGKYICLLNNDTEVTSGWIDNAIEVFKKFDSVGAVGCKLLYPNGALQEAGGLIWGNGAPWNYGKGQNANHPGYNYVRDADYLSAAALFVRKGSWKEVGGFSSEFAPAYYEDTDLAYKLRDAGYRTMYCPGSVVIHFEGGSNGVDENSGLKAYQKKNAEKFKSKWYEQFNEYGEEGYKPHLEVDRACKQRVLVIDANTPRINNDAGSHAAIQEIKMLRELGSKVTFFPLNIAHMGIHTEYLQEIGVECIYYPFFVSLEQLLLLRGQEFDLVYITRYEAVLSVIDIVRNHTSAKVIFNNADLHFMRELRETLQLELRDMSGPLATREMELKAINSTDLTLCYTESERAIITSHILEQDKVMCCPWVMKSVENTRSFDERVGIAFLGGFQHRPNVFGVKYFVSEVMPQLVARMPDMVFHVYGSGMPADIEELQSPNVKIEGFVEDLSDVFAKARLFVCPLLTGAGLNGKIIDCIAHGLPAVVSPLTADGSGLVHKQNALIAEDVDDWVNYVELLYTDRELWLQYSARLRDLSEGIYSGSEGVRRMSGILERVGISVDKSKKRLFQDFAQ